MDIEAIKAKALQAIAPLESVDTDAYGGTRTHLDRNLPEYYLVYFLLVDLLGFKCLGRHEKLAWSIPLDLRGRLLHIEYRKMGLGVFSSGEPNSEASAEEVVGLIHNGIRVARPYFDWRADQAVQESKVNIINRSVDLHERFKYLLDAYKSKLNEAEQGARVVHRANHNGGPVEYRFPNLELLRQAQWLATSAIESFFSWTEHVFILLAVMQRKCTTGDSVKNLAYAEWKEKFSAALDIRDPEVKRHYDSLTIIRGQVRNFVAHGSFGKSGEAFQFHSATGAVPVLLPHRRRQSYRFLTGAGVVAESEAIASIEQFVEYIRTGPLAPAWIYLDTGMRLVLTEARWGHYEYAMESIDSMQELVDMETYIDDINADMDW